MTKVYEIRVDEEYNGEQFWDAAHELHDLLGRFVNTEVPLNLEEREKELLFKTLATLPGWVGGPAHAPSPVLVVDVTQ